jgi:hypothetical protein
MSGITLTEYRKIDPKISDCICGSSDVDGTAKKSSDCWTIYADVWCNSCGLSINNTVSVSCHGEPGIASAYTALVKKWNKLMARKDAT